MVNPFQLTLTAKSLLVIEKFLRIISFPRRKILKREEYPRVNYAQQYDVRGTLAVPVLERGTRHCLGVVEVVLTTQKIKYRPELESVCKALEV
ncbi:hypothetical protein RD792_000549 [Penstemon davidsonii]|uniref:GAF domain-containing protein n=1 Tax=Penstemon davidsonii TaxID=160366 RepID=A0ABR0DKZ8_9LAMI|nr:hypothetical protein RD792_000549 [Penstemon davidsonii]